MTTLISFLGKNRRNPATIYQLATYAFDDGQQVKTPFFGSALMQRLRPQRTLLLGTAGSMWDALDLDTEAPEWRELVEATETETVDQPLLDRVSQRARASMQGAELVLIPYCRDEAEQMNLLADLAARIGEGEQVALDITHSFRHLPLLALVAARYLTHVRKAVVRDIYYGALEMTANGVTPVLKLDGLLRMLDWIEAFAAHDASGNYGAFAPLLVHDGMKPASAALLERAAHLERVTNSSKAREIVLPMLGEISQLGGATRLFVSQLEQRLSWARKPSREARERALHEAYLARKDFLRAVIYLQESAISAACDRLKIDHNAHANREEARQSLKVSSAFSSLSDIRNMLAHGTVSGSTARTQAAIGATANAADLHARLHQLGTAMQTEFR
jgi:CRISPR-associated Csx2 family protein